VVMASIPLYRKNGSITAYTLVDDADYARPEIKGRLWRQHPKGYAMRRETNNTIYLHRVILSAPKGLEVDHINGNVLDNCRYNLRLVTSAQQQQNMKRYRSNTSGHRGVTWNRRRKKWQAQIQANGYRPTLGCFTKFEEACEAYDAASQKYHPFAQPRRDK
jgi:HNH endonuclease/AP2 domain